MPDAFKFKEWKKEAVCLLCFLLLLFFPAGQVFCSGLYMPAFSGGYAEFFFKCAVKTRIFFKTKLKADLANAFPTLNGMIAGREPLF